MTNLYFDYLPDGFIVKYSILKLYLKLSGLLKNFDKEHVTSYIWKNPKIFKIKYFKGKKLKFFQKT